MELDNTPGFFQSRMEKTFGTYLWKFVLVHMDDIMVVSPETEEHSTHLDEVLELREQSGVIVLEKNAILRIRV